MKRMEDERLARMIKAARAVIDTSPPRPQPHLDLKLKKMQKEDDRLATIDRDNRLLLDKIAQTNRMGGRGIDNAPPRHRPPSNNRRLREITRILHENQAILKRLGAVETTLKLREKKRCTTKRGTTSTTRQRLPPTRTTATARQTTAASPTGGAVTLTHPRLPAPTPVTC